MQTIEHLFEAKAANPLETANLYNTAVGFRIPEYQRQYDWEENDIKRLYYDVLNGFQRLADSSDANAFTFLGTLILVEEGSRERDFGGHSVAVVDGQQRLTTLALFACSLTEALRRQQARVDYPVGIKAHTKEWLHAEVADRMYSLYSCAVGLQRIPPRNSFPFPRIVRTEDARGRSAITAEYRSPIGLLLDGFARYFEDDEIEYLPPALGNGAHAKRVEDRFRLIRELVAGLNDQEWYDDTECDQFRVEWATRGQCRKQFARLTDYFEADDERNKAIQSIVNHERIHDLVRLLLFSSYFCNCIVLTRVTTKDPATAFDIFDALNTTGQPLTALETLKPRVIHFEEQRGHYAGSDSCTAFDSINRDLDQRFTDTSKKQSETKDLVVTFALYLEGKKLSKDLAAQRNFLRRSFDGAIESGDEAARIYTQSLAELAQFRRYYWERDGIDELGRFHHPDRVGKVQVLMSFISSMRTSLALPILARYWTPELRNAGDGDFLSVLESVVAFVVIRRGATGGTAGIDSDFRAIMAPPEGRGADRKFSLCAGSGLNKPRLEIGELKRALRTLLKHKLRSLERDSWARKTSRNPLYVQSGELARFMILAAAHHARPSKTHPGNWTRKDCLAGDTNDFLNFQSWRNKRYSTVEHVAPRELPSISDWSQDLYHDNILRHCLGNLTLLPPKENSAFGNSSWKKKKKLYQALTEMSESGRDKRLQEARASGITISDGTIELLKSGGALSLLNPLRNVEDWSHDLVQRRSINIAKQCWDIVWPWLQ